MSVIDNIITRDKGKAVKNPIIMVRFLEEDEHYSPLAGRKELTAFVGFFALDYSSLRRCGLLHQYHQKYT